MELKLGQVYYIEFCDKEKEPIVIRLVARDFENLYGVATNLKGEWFESSRVVDCEAVKNTFIASNSLLTVLSFAEQAYKKSKRKNDKKMNNWLGKR
ncbi:hypothetical protein RAK27_11915 [Carnobacterium maltaromaticum]|uniref:Uncharacterized protein n=1 Tax=Carnobacterium maltaromaticum TaxID=2751 RepID=A0AAW9K486_CARML|nr:hypothetical protein [Carnobacterium maltaromaticum]MDZ5759370.1 hypothetical protein [Carnobacterium maltaromaticum]